MEGERLACIRRQYFFDETSSKDCTWNLNETFAAFAVMAGYGGTVTVSAAATLTLSGIAVAPAAPSELNAVAVSSVRVDVAWTDNASTETGFEIERKIGLGETFSQIGTADMDATTYSDTDPSLLPGTSYYYRVRAYDPFSASPWCDEAAATTFAETPAAATNPVSNNAGTSATLNSVVNPKGAETSAYFQWGTDTSYGNATPPQTVPAGTSDVAVAASIAWLAPNTSYHYRIVAENSVGTTNGSDLSFTTPIIPPSATTDPAGSIMANSAFLNATVNPNGAETSVSFQWGTDTSYGTTTTPQVLPAGVDGVAAFANVSGLTAGRTYHYRVFAVNSAGAAYGDDVSFTTPSHAPPLTETAPAGNKNGNSATLNGFVNPNGLKTSVYFEWGLTAAYGNTTDPHLLPPGVDNVPFFADIAGLSINTTYHFRVVAVNVNGTTHGTDVAFTTPPITITIVSPTGGTSIERPDVLVRGNLQTPGHETGVTVDGMAGMVYNNEFAVNHVPLSDGENTITVTATDTEGNVANTAVRVTALVSGPSIRLDGNPDAGVEPLTVNFTLWASLPTEATGYTIDFDGDGTPDATGTHFDDTGHVYASPGIYYGTVTVTAGASYEDTIAVTVLNSSDLDSLLKAKWNAMKAALGLGNIGGALDYYAARTRARYDALYSAISGDLPQLVPGIGDIELIVAEGGQAKYRLRKSEPAGQITYYVYFVIDADGVWKILQY